MTTRKLQNILVTGGAGFIGSNFIHYLFGMSTSGNPAFTDANFGGTVVNVACLTYAGNRENLAEHRYAEALARKAAEAEKEGPSEA